MVGAIMAVREAISSRGLRRRRGVGRMGIVAALLVRVGMLVVEVVVVRLLRRDLGRGCIVRSNILSRRGTDQ